MTDCKSCIEIFKERGEDPTVDGSWRYCSMSVEGRCPIDQTEERLERLEEIHEDDYIWFPKEPPFDLHKRLRQVESRTIALQNKVNNLLIKKKQEDDKEIPPYTPLKRKYRYK